MAMKLPPLPRPPGPKLPPVAQPPASKPGLGAEASPKRAVSQVNKDYVYEIPVRLNTPGPSVMTVASLVHAKLLSEAKVIEHCAAAMEVVNKTRIPARREEVNQSRVAIDTSPAGIAQFNERFFSSDVETFEAVMMDKFGYRRLIKTTIEPVSIDPTIITKTH